MGAWWRVYITLCHRASGGVWLWWGRMRRRKNRSSVCISWWHDVPTHFPISSLLYSQFFSDCLWLYSHISICICIFINIYIYTRVFPLVGNARPSYIEGQHGREKNWIAREGGRLKRVTAKDDFLKLRRWHAVTIYFSIM